MVRKAQFCRSPGETRAIAAITEGNSFMHKTAAKPLFSAPDGTDLNRLLQNDYKLLFIKKYRKWT
jgi:hypothetical protein